MVAITSGVSLEATPRPLAVRDQRADPRRRQRLRPAPQGQRGGAERGRDLHLGARLDPHHRHRREPAPGGVPGVPGEGQVPVHEDPAPVLVLDHRGRGTDLGSADRDQRQGRLGGHHRHRRTPTPPDKPFTYYIATRPGIGSDTPANPQLTTQNYRPDTDTVSGVLSYVEQGFLTTVGVRDCPRTGPRCCAPSARTSGDFSGSSQLVGAAHSRRPVAARRADRPVRWESGFAPEDSAGLPRVPVLSLMMPVAIRCGSIVRRNLSRGSSWPATSSWASCSSRSVNLLPSSLSGSGLDR